MNENGFSRIFGKMYLFCKIGQCRVQNEYDADICLTGTFERFGCADSGNDRGRFQLSGENLFCVFNGITVTFDLRKFLSCESGQT